MTNEGSAETCSHANSCTVGTRRTQGVGRYGCGNAIQVAAHLYREPGMDLGARADFDYRTGTPVIGQFNGVGFG